MYKLNKSFKNILTFLNNIKCITCLCLIACINLSKIVDVSAQNGCTNPNGKSGLCVSIYQCNSLLSVLQNISISEESSPEKQFLLESQCSDGYGNPPFVCCTADKKYAQASTTSTNHVEQSTAATSPQPKNISPSNGLGNVLPEPPRCGPDPLNGKIYNGIDTVLDQFPWMVLLEYKKNGQPVLNCGGSLINQRYILTAAHCVKGDIEREVGPLSRIRLGEYDISSEIDCMGSDCNNKVLELGFEEVVPHPEYDPNNANRYHDIALIRLAQDIDYNDFIRPVCLPLARTKQPINSGALLTVAGWGRTLLARQSNVKKQLDVPVNDHNACVEKFRPRKIVIGDSQICAGGEFAKDSCDGDSGGPLMRKAHKQRWYLEGIVSFGNRCGLEGWPGVYTRVADYVDWIESNIKP